MLGAVLKLDIQAPELDEAAIGYDRAAVERKLQETVRRLLHRRGLPRGGNLVGVAAAARDAASNEASRQFESMMAKSGGTDPFMGGGSG